LKDTFEKIVFPTNTDINEKYANWIQFIAGSGQSGGTKGSVYLPLPQNITFGTNLQWNDISLGIIEGVVDEFTSSMDSQVDSNASTYEKFVNSGNQVLNSLESTVKNVGANNITLQTALVAEAYMQTGMRLPAGLDAFQGPLNSIKEKVLRNNRVAINPNTELYFKGVGLRDFSFRFLLVPKSRKDSSAIRNLIKFFEKWSHPDFLNGSRYVFHYPEEFIISFISNGEPNDNFPAINRCVCTSFTHTYMENSNALMQDNTPPSVSISVRFREVEVNTRGTINRLQSDFSRLNRYEKENQQKLVEQTVENISKNVKPTNIDGSPKQGLPPIVGQMFPNLFPTELPRSIPRSIPTN
jgi:hypothetical protein